MTDLELATFLGIETDPRWPRAIAALTGAQRAAYEGMARRVEELRAYAAGCGPRAGGYPGRWASVSASP
jgi:hypothetical protein